MARRVFITVAEVSGDRHAAQLIHSLKQLEPDLIIEGHGGPEMAAAGAAIHVETVGNAAMGWRGALRAFEIYKVLKWTRRYFSENKPDLQIGVDSPSMNFHFARAAHERGVPVLQYVAPQLWAWAEGRMKKVRRWIDRLACILPFEEKYFRDHGVDATFVGHPLFDALPAARTATENEARFPNRPPVVGILPGSRKSVAAQNFPHQLHVARAVAAEFPGSHFLVPTTRATRPVVEALAAKWGEPDPGSLPSASGARFRDRAGNILETAQDAFDEMVPRCDLCLTVSGTATLHVAAFAVPMIVVYRINGILWHLAVRWMVRARTYTVVNILAAGGPRARHEDHVVPEIIPWYGSDEPAAQLVLQYLREPHRLAEQSRRLRELIQPLDRHGASMNVARMALELMDQSRTNAPTTTAMVAAAP